MNRQFIRFFAVGLVNSFIGLLVIFAAKAFLGMADVAANATGYIIGLSVSFVLNRSWTFRHDGDLLAAAVRFVAVFLVAYSLNLAVVMALIHWAGTNEYLAHALGMPPYAVSFFLLSKYFAFKPGNAMKIARL